MKLVLAVAGIVLMSPPPGAAQSAGLKFEVASIKPANPDNQRIGGGPVPGGGYKAGNVNLRFLILFAYNIPDFQLSGGPGWITSDRYDIEAKPEKPDVRADYANETATARVRERMRALLAERFQLAVRKDTRELSTYVLTVAKGGLKMTESNPDGPKGGLRRDHGLLKAIGAPVDFLVRALTDLVGRPVVDQTGLAGKRFDFELRFSEEAPMAPGLKPNALPAEAAADSPYPTLFSALQSQLGLKLEPAKAPAEFIIIESAAKPSAN